MNFNPMDLILVKEHFEGLFNCVEIDTISNFINLLIELQQDGITDKDLVENLTKTNFFNKQEMVELAYKIQKLGGNKNGILLCK